MRRLVFLGFVMMAGMSALAEQPKSHWTKFGEDKIRYYDVGDRRKDALVFVHCWTCNADFWKGSISAFPKYRVIAMDLVGHGQSDKPKAEYSMEYFARSVAAVLEKAGVRRAVLVGHSMGTPVIRQFYRLYPEKTIALVVVDGALRPFGPREQTEKFFEPLFTNYEDQAPRFIDGILGPTRADLKNYIRTAMLATPDYVGRGAMKGMLDDKIWTDDQINVPVLAILAAGSWPPDIETTYRSIAPKLEFHMWTDVSHFLMMEKPMEFNEQVKEFVVGKKLL